MAIRIVSPVCRGGAAPSLCNRTRPANRRYGKKYRFQLAHQVDTIRERNMPKQHKIESPRRVLNRTYLMLPLLAVYVLCILPTPGTD